MVNRNELDKLITDNNECAWHFAARATPEITKLVHETLDEMKFYDPFKNDHRTCEIYNSDGGCKERVTLDEIYLALLGKVNESEAGEGKECSLFSVARDNAAIQSTRTFRNFIVKSIRQYGCLDCKDGKNKACKGYDGSAR
ncbi:MAG: hypothetical protein MUF61_01605 [archaeon]|jgi:hypothetical protein|nr:hypothetical protein [archaeon]